MNIELTAHFYFKGSGKKKTVNWIEIILDYNRKRKIRIRSYVKSR